MMYLCRRLIAREFRDDVIRVAKDGEPGVHVRVDRCRLGIGDPEFGFWPPRSALTHRSCGGRINNARATTQSARPAT